MTPIDRVRAVLESPADEAAAESLASDDAAILWVDWRDEDDIDEVFALIDERAGRGAGERRRLP